MTEVEGMSGIVHTFQEYKKENNMHYFEESLETLLKKYDNEEIAMLNLIARMIDVLDNSSTKDINSFFIKMEEISQMKQETLLPIIVLP